VTLAEEFRQMCQTYFPRWHAATAWCLEERPCASWIEAHGQGQVTPARSFCDPTTRRITIDVSRENVLQRQATMMHAICHAITTVGHGARFRAQMDRAATRAQALGATALAEALHRQVQAYRSFGRLQACEAHTSARPLAPHAQLTDQRRLLTTS
jgi:hypothetical protein